MKNHAFIKKVNLIHEFHSRELILPIHWERAYLSTYLGQVTSMSHPELSFLSFFRVYLWLY